jgi:signal transduction histidine kinase
MDVLTAGQPSTVRPVPRLCRRPDRALVGGVAAGIAEHAGVRTRHVRIVFLLLSAAGGLGVALYGAYLIVLPAAPGVGRSRLPRPVEWVVAVAAAAAAVGIAATTLPETGLFVPTLLACLGGALIWRQASEPERVRLRSMSRDSLAARDRLGRVRLAAGAALVIAGGALVLARADVTAIRDGVLAMVVTLVGVVLLSGPWWIRMTTQLSAERSERIRSQERADIAAHLHDSVLQTLALIQRNAASPREVARLARGQERTLRSLLYADRAASGQFAEGLRAVAAEVEDAYAVKVDVVVVGDAALDDALAAVVAATREALVNAARHSGADTVSVYAELEAEEASVFVRDRGTGFDADAVADDRQGIRGSVVGRIERHGGRATLLSSPDTGTEVEMHMPLGRAR